MALVTLVLVGWTAWLRFGPASRPEPPAVGLALPPLRLLDLETAEPLVLLGAKGKVTWIVFWSAGSPSGRASLSKLEGVWKRLKSHRRFTMVTAAINSDQPERVRTALAEIHATVPASSIGTYLSQVAENSAGVRYSRELCGRSVLLIDEQRT